MKNLYEHIQALADAAPGRTALMLCGKTDIETHITYAELRMRIEEAAAGLSGVGIKPGERIALKLSSPIEHLVLTWAAWASGISVVPLDPRRDTKDMESFKLAASGARTVLREMPRGEGPIQWSSDLSHEALVLFTSGTTARPKGAILTLDNIVTNARGILTWLGITPNDTFLAVLPLHHINSTTFCLATLLAGGATAVSSGYSSSGFWTQAAAVGATFTSIVQSILFDQLNRAREHDAVRERLRLSRIQIGSAPVVARSVEDFMHIYGIPVYQGYGQTETSLRVTGVPMNVSPALYKKLVEENSIGAPMEWAEVEVMNDAGEILGEGEEGELVVRGPAVMSGYVGGEEAFRSGYFATGDAGFWRMFEGRRFFYLKGRKKELIIKGGINISPVAVENALRKISADIDQAYAIGVVDERYGEEIGAIVCWKSGTDEEGAMRRLKSRLLAGTEHLSAYEAPTHLFSMPASELPLTSTGKVQRSALKERTIQWQPIVEVFRTPSHRFRIVRPFSEFEGASHALHNHCWQPLEVSAEGYREFLGRYLTLAAIDDAGRIAGQIAFSPEGVEALTCVSICSAAYKARPVPAVAAAPTPEEVEAYATQGLDPVLNFHFKLGARLVETIPNGRPEDRSSLGYVVRMSYAVPARPQVEGSAPVSHQLIQSVLRFAADTGRSRVDALSRPGGLAYYLSKHSV